MTSSSFALPTPGGVRERRAPDGDDGLFQGQGRLIELGCRQGGPAGFGLRRLLVDERGQPKGQLERGEQKSIQTDRVILVPGPDAEVDLVQRIYRFFLAERRSEREIASTLNAEGKRTDRGTEWTRGTVHEVLTNEKYVGDNVFNRVSFKLKKKRVRNPAEMWLRRRNAFDPIVDPADFHTVRGIILARHRRLSDDEMLARLRALISSLSESPTRACDFGRSSRERVDAHRSPLSSRTPTRRSAQRPKSRRSPPGAWSAHATSALVA